MRPKFSISKGYGMWYPAFTIGMQTFKLRPMLTKEQAKWYITMLRIALKNFEDYGMERDSKAERGSSKTKGTKAKKAPAKAKKAAPKKCANKKGIKKADTRWRRIE